MTKTFKSLTLAAVLLAAQSISAGTAVERARAHFSAAEKPFRWAPKAKNTPAEWHSLSSKAKVQKLQAKAPGTPDLTLAPGDDVTYLDMPDGSTWFVVSTLDKKILEQNEYYTDFSITGVHATFYNDQLKPVGKIDTEITCPEGFERCNSIQFGAAVSKKFFNLDDNYEVMLLTNFNPASGYGATPFTKVFSLRGATTNAVEVTTLPGYYMAAVNNASDAWSEDFFMQFFSGERYTDEEMFYLFDIYSKASYGNPGPNLVHSFMEDMMLVMSDGENESMPVMINSRGKELYVTCAHYEKTFMKNPFDYTDETINENNRYIIDLYKKNGSKNELMKVSTTAIPCEPAPEGMFMHTYSLGSFLGIEDITFDYSTDLPSFVIAISDTDNNENTYTHYCVYNTAGEVIKKFGEGNQGYMRLSSVEGQPEQFVFLMPDSSNEIGLKYSFYNWPEMELATEIPVVLSHEEGTSVLSMNLDRAPGWGSYRYAFSGAYGDTDDLDNTLHEILWFDAKGDHVRIDRINAGQNINMIKPLVAGYALNPYLFNTDAAQEYIYFALRRDDSEAGRATTEICVGNQKGETIFQYAFPYNASQMSAALLNLATRPVLWICHLDDATDKFITEFVDLPLNKLQGEGSEANPYILCEPGDWSQLKSNLNANFTIARDIDFEGNPIPAVSGIFSGAIDGAGHALKNFTLASQAMFEQLAPKTDGKKVVLKNININNVSTEGVPAILAGRASNAQLLNIQLRDINVASASSTESFGALAQTATVGTLIEGCGVSNLSVNLPEAEGVGGLVGSLGVNSKINASAVSGKITADSNVGGIVASTDAATTQVSNCHVNADLSARYNIGGLIGTAERGIVCNNVTEGTATSTGVGYKYSEKNGRVPVLNLGGLIGSLKAAFATYDDNGNPVAANTDTIVSKNFVYVRFDHDNISNEDFQAASSTANRVIGHSRINEDPEYLGEDYNEETGEWEIRWGRPARAEEGLAFNYVHPLLSISGSGTPLKDNSVHGEQVDFPNLRKDFFAALGFEFDGRSMEAPWEFDTLPVLYFEKIAGTSMAFDPAEITIAEGSKARVTLLLEGIDFEALTIEVSDEAGLSATPVELDEAGNAIFEIEVLKAGSYTVTATNGSLTATLKVDGKTSSLADVAASTAISYDGHTVSAPGADLTLYSATGAVVAKGRESISTDLLPRGIYIASTGTATRKIAVK